MTDIKVNRYFIADIHLNEAMPDITMNFMRFLQQLPDNCELYILGDLFDYWIGDDAQTALHIDVSSKLRSLSVRGIRLFFIRGNRDFLLGKKYADLCKMTILPDVHTLAHNERCILIMHGDILCSHDKAYQRFRKFMHNSLLQNIFLLLPLCLRRKIVNNLRQRSTLNNRTKLAYKMDVNPETIKVLMQKYNADVLIQGHIHKPGYYRFKIEGKHVERLVLGAWDDNSDYVIAAEAIKLISLPSV